MTSDASGNVTVDVPALGVKLYQADSPIPSRTFGIYVTLDTPAEGAEDQARGTKTGLTPLHRRLA